MRHLFAGGQGGYRLLGWSVQSYYAEFAVLLHPGRSEPYGMVICLAMSARVRVVCSDVCGAAAQVMEVAGAILSLVESFDRWGVDSVKEL